MSHFKRGLLVLGLIPLLALSQFPVIDVAAVAQAVAAVAQIIQVYNEVTQTYNQIAYSAGWTRIKTPWLGVATPMVLSSTRTIFGETGAWNTAVTTGVGIPPAWSEATYAINPPFFYAGYPLGGSSVSANIASILVADGMSQAAMETIANSRINQPKNDWALSNLEESAQDTTLDTNSEVEQLNQLASASVLANRQAEDANALLTTIAEQQILTNKIQRDTLAADLNVMSIRDAVIASQAIGWGGDAALFASYQQ